jgi:hypothetical protein
MTTRLTAAELGTSQRNYDALLAARAILEAPELPKGMRFDMKEFVTELFERDEDGETHTIGTPMHTCGTAMCIGGTMQLCLSGIGLDVVDLTDTQDVLLVEKSEIENEVVFVHLFYPSLIYHWENITPADAVKAIDNFLAGNTKDPWGPLRDEINGRSPD